MDFYCAFEQECFIVIIVKILTKINFQCKYPNVLAGVFVLYHIYPQMRDFGVKSVLLKVVVLTQI